MRAKAFYLCLLVFTVYVEIMYDDSHGVLFLGFEMLLLFAMLALALYLKFHVKVEARVETYCVNKGKPVVAQITVTNRGWLPASRIRGYFVLENAWGSANGREAFQYEADARKRMIRKYHFPVIYCGKYTFCGKRAKVFDYLGLFRFSAGKESRGDVLVLPDFYQIPVEVTEGTRRFPVDGEEYDPHRSGDDPSEIFQIREYRPGDGMQRIHWKMSAKAGEWMTKEYGLPVGCCVLVLLDLKQERRDQAEAARLDQILETAVSISYSLALAGCMHDMAWYETRTDRIQRISIRSEEDIYKLQEEILEAFPYDGADDLEAGYASEFPEKRYATVLRLDISLILWKDGEVYADLSEGERNELGDRLILRV